MGRKHTHTHNVAFVPLLSHNLLSLKQSTRRAGHSYRGDGDEVTLFCKSGRWFLAPTIGKLDQMRGYRARSDSACATISPAVKPPNIDTEVDINEFHCSFGHVHKELLLETAKQRDVTLTGELHECKRCSMAKVRKKPIAKTTKSRADKRGGRVFLDVCGPKSVRSIGGKEYMLLVKDDFFRFSAVYFMRSKSEVSKYFKQYLADHRFSGAPSPVETVRTDDAAEFKSGYFAELCRERGIRQELTTANSPQFNGVAERGIAMIESAGKVALIQAKCTFSGMGIPLSDSLWAAQTYWAFNALNFTAAKANPKCKSPYEMWYGRTPPSPFPFLKPGFVKRKRTNKLEPPAVPCFYVGPSPNRPRDSMRVIFSSGTMIDSRDVTWARIPRLASVLCEQGGQEPTELQEMESVEGETNLSDGESDELQSDRQKSTGDEEDDDDQESIRGGIGR